MLRSIKLLSVLLLLLIVTGASAQDGASVLRYPITDRKSVV